MLTEEALLAMKLSRSYASHGKISLIGFPIRVPHFGFAVSVSPRESEASVTVFR